MEARFKDGSLEGGPGRAVVSSVYRGGRSLFDPAVGVAIEFSVTDWFDNYCGTIIMRLSPVEASDLCDKVSAIVQRIKSHQPTHERYE